MPPSTNAQRLYDYNSPTIFEDLANDTLGLRTPYLVRDPQLADELRRKVGLDGVKDGQAPQVYFDNTASTHALPPVLAAAKKIRRHYGNPHADHTSAKIATKWYEHAHDWLLRFVGADPKTHMAVFAGAGATEVLNRVAHNLFRLTPNKDRPGVLYTEAEHHANMLPWRDHAQAFPIHVDPVSGRINMRELQETLREVGHKIRLVAMTGASNVTGMIPDIPAVSKLVHASGAELLIDAAQLAAHRAVNMLDAGIDFLVLAGHKGYAPGSQGALVMPINSAPAIPHLKGGGVVKGVSLQEVLWADRDREEAGTPNVPAAVMMIAALKTLHSIGMDRVWEHEVALIDNLIFGLKNIPGVQIYGDSDTQQTPRVGVVSFNIEGLHHSLVSRILSDYFNIATRNGCFCAHPYVSALLGISQAGFIEHLQKVGEGTVDKPGMVRASVGVYTNAAEIDYFLEALYEISTHKEQLKSEYTLDAKGHVSRNDGWEPYNDDEINPYDDLLPPDEFDAQIAAEQNNRGGADQLVTGSIVTQTGTNVLTRPSLVPR